jgi:phosphomannomutase
MKDFVLFDMDGTLTLARRPMNPDIIQSLRALAGIAEIGIISGSDYDYIEEQILRFLPAEICTRCAIFPCNGTKVRKLCLGTGEWPEFYSTSMQGEIGYSHMRDLILWLLENQAKIIHYFHELPLTGTFISNRGSLVNWCPIGRQATLEDRGKFVEIDQGCNLRERYVEDMRRSPVFNGLTIALGGQTSFDIYPDGWDKTYALRHLEGKRVWFVGDRCQPGGNDHAVYAKLASMGRAWETSGPEETVRIIAEIMEHIKGE